MIKRLTVSLLLGFLLAACATNKKVFVPISPSADKGSVIYLYRPTKAANSMLSPEISIVGVKDFEINGGEYKQFYLLPGEHVIKLAKTEGNTPAVEHRLKVVKGQIHYVRIDASMKLEYGLTYQPYKRKFELLEVSPEKAVTEIVACDDMDAQVKKKKSAITGEAAFSVDKTSNPFSR